MRAECYFCHIRTIQKLTDKFKPDDETAALLIKTFHDFLYQNWDMTNPELATKVHRIAKSILKNQDLYASEKEEANKTLLDDYHYWRNFIDQSNDPFATAAKLAVVGNIIDYGAHSLEGNLKEQINMLFQKPLKIDHSEILRKEIEGASSILYLGDNAGEIFFDRLFIETISHANLTFVTRGEAVINDITIEDAKQMGIHNFAKVISNGYDAPSTLLNYCSKEFLNAYKNSDLIISKGQGNFEGLLNENHANTYFMLIAKCREIAKMISVEKNDLVIKKNHNVL